MLVRRQPITTLFSKKQNFVKINKDTQKLLNPSNKLEFFHNPQISQQMPASEVEAIAAHYQQKYGIVILKNGGSPKGKRLILNKQANLHKKYVDDLDLLSDESIKYAEFIEISGFLLNTASLHEYKIGKDNNQLLLTLCDSYLFNKELKDNLEPEDYQQINAIIHNHPVAKKILDDAINKYLEDLRIKNTNQINNCCLNHHEAWEEIIAVQEALRDDQVVGYVYTNGFAVNGNHFEVLIISKNEIIKPITWHTLEPYRQILDYQNKPMSQVRLNSPDILKKESGTRLPQPQADVRACATLGFLYLKELLKEDCLQLKDYTLRFPIFENGRETWLFYPSPQVLRYSQSSKYNEVLRLMLVSSREMQPYPQMGFKVATLKKLLEDSIQYAATVGKHEVAAHNSRILATLPQFRERWLTAYQSAVDKRVLMQDEKSLNNHYLAYSTFRLHKYTSSQPEQTGWDTLNVTANLTPIALV